MHVSMTRDFTRYNQVQKNVKWLCYDGLITKIVWLFLFSTCLSSGEPRLVENYTSKEKKPKLETVWRTRKKKEGKKVFVSTKKNWTSCCKKKGLCLTDFITQV